MNGITTLGSKGSLGGEGGPVLGSAGPDTHFPIRWTTQSCWHSGQRLFCLTQSDMQQLWKEWLHSPQTTAGKPRRNNQWGGDNTSSCNIKTFSTLGLVVERCCSSRTARSPLLLQSKSRTLVRTVSFSQRRSLPCSFLITSLCLTGLETSRSTSYFFQPPNPVKSFDTCVTTLESNNTFI